MLTTIRYFRDEYEAHIKEKKCPAGECVSLRKFAILPDKCKRCSACARKCPAGAISGSAKEPYVIDEVKCIGCGVCEKTCRFGAVVRK